MLSSKRGTNTPKKCLKIQADITSSKFRKKKIDLCFKPHLIKLGKTTSLKLRLKKKTTKERLKLKILK